MIKKVKNRITAPAHLKKSVQDGRCAPSTKALISVWVTATEKEMIKKAAKKAGDTTSGWVAKLALNEVKNAK